MTETVELPLRALAERAMRHSWFPVARSIDVQPGPVPAVLLGTKLAVFRDGDGIARVVENRCPHRGGSLGHGRVTDGSIACPYHGWRFDGGSGACAFVPSLADQSMIPPRAAVATFPAVERYGHVWTVLEEPVRELYENPHWKDLDLEWLAAEPLDSSTGVGVAIENFRDVAHFPFVHEVSMGPTPEVVAPLEVQREGFDVFMARELDAGTGDWAEQGDCTMYYHCSAPGFATITYDYERLGRRVVAGFPSPVAYDRLVIFWGVANEVGFRGDSLEANLEIETEVYREDLPIADKLEPREIPWDREFQEHSVPSDVFTLNYRRSFREFMDAVAQRFPEH